MKILKNKKIILVLLLTIATGVIVEATASKNKKNSAPRQLTHTVNESSENSEVDLEVEFKNYQKEDPEFLEFEVFLNTHSEDLSQYDNFVDFLKLIVDEVPVNTEIFLEKRGSGHHISNILKIKNDYQGKKILDENTKEIKLIFHNISGVEERIHSYSF